MEAKPDTPSFQKVGEVLLTKGLCNPLAGYVGMDDMLERTDKRLATPPAESTRANSSNSSGRCCHRPPYTRWVEVLPARPDGSLRVRQLPCQRPPRSLLPNKGQAR